MTVRRESSIANVDNSVSLEGAKSSEGTVIPEWWPAEQKRLATRVASDCDFSLHNLHGEMRINRLAQPVRCN